MPRPTTWSHARPQSALRRKNTFFIHTIQDLAKQISEAFEAEIAAGRITEQDLFDSTYSPIADTNPEQVLTPLHSNDRPGHAPPFRSLPSICMKRLSLLLPWTKTAICQHTTRSSRNRKAQTRFGTPPIAANRRIFDDRVGAGAGQNTKPFLLQNLSTRYGWWGLCPDERSLGPDLCQWQTLGRRPHGLPCKLESCRRYEVIPAVLDW